jgi:UDP-glucose:(heptosyl)LPS alpha-1,3-glucosyltransferase
MKLAQLAGLFHLPSSIFHPGRHSSAGLDRAPARRRRLRIAFVVHDYNRVLGHSRYVVELAERFALEHEVHVFANTFEQLPPMVVGHHVPALRTWALSTIFSFVLPASLMVGRKFDIIHAQGFAIISPDVITAHISNARWLEGRRLLEDGKLSFRERLFGALVIPAERRTMRDRQATVIAVSAALRDDLVRGYGRDADTVVIPHGVDRRQFHPGVRSRFRETVRTEIGMPEDVPVFLYVGDFRKGFEQAVRALAAAGGAHLIGVSRTPAERYRRVANECGVSDRVTMLPPTGTIERYYGAADALILPTPYDAFGMVITEAMSCGLPVITTPLAGAAELITQNVNGLLVQSPTDVEGFSAAMRLLATDDAVRHRLGAAAAALMREHTWDSVAERTLRVYDDHLARRASCLSSTG